ncbi:hypothetical protein JOS77_29125 [Chromobacterium haemolyticum]|nr:hypothetical protein JOS77_29125 [Chromobacterium haemolyticum]
MPTAMAHLDVTDVLLDPDFMDTGLNCIRTQLTTGSNGRDTSTQTTTPFFGVITSDRGDILDRLAGAERVVGSITIHTPFRLVDGRDPGITADIVTWKGNHYTVSNVNDYSHFGKGFICASCEPISLSGGS